MNFIYNFVLKLSNIQPTWIDSTISGIYMTLFYISGFLILSMVIYFISRAIITRKQTFVPKFSLSLSFTITSFLGFLVSAVFFLLFLTSWIHWEHFYFFIPELPTFLVPFAFFLCLYHSFLIWFIFEKRKQNINKFFVV